VSPRFATLAIVVLAPLLLAASDPAGDTGPCSGQGTAPGNPPDLVSVFGWRGEDGTSAVWRFTFASPLEVPDPAPPAFRVDVLVRDPTIPTVSFAYRGLRYREVNRIVRFDATSREQTLQLLFLPEGGATTFNPPTVNGTSMVIQVPGRLLLGEVGDDLAAVDLTKMRWTVVVRDLGSCDVLGGGSPWLPLGDGPPDDSISPAPVVAAGGAGPASSIPPLVAILVVAAVVASGAALLVARSRGRVTPRP
jgi:hypothetical protein